MSGYALGIISNMPKKKKTLKLNHPNLKTKF